MYDMEMWLGMLKKFIEAEPVASSVIVGMALMSSAYVVKAVLVAVTDIVTSPFKTVVAIVTVIFGTVQVVFRGHASCCPTKCCEKGEVKAPSDAVCCASLDVDGLVGELMTGKPSIRHPLEHDMTAHRRSNKA